MKTPVKWVVRPQCVHFAITIANDTDNPGLTIAPEASTAIAIDLTNANITNAIDIDDNFILFDGIRVFEASTGNLTFEDTGNNDLAIIRDLGDYGSFYIDPKSDAGNPASCTEGDIYTNANDGNIYYCYDTNLWVDLTQQTGVGGSSNWTLNETNESIYPNNLTVDLLMGGIATASAHARIAGLEVATGNILDINSDTITTGDVVNITSTALEANGSLLFLANNTANNGYLIQAQAGAGLTDRLTLD